MQPQPKYLALNEHHGLLADLKDLLLEILGANALLRKRNGHGVVGQKRGLHLEPIRRKRNHLAAAQWLVCDLAPVCPNKTHKLVLGGEADFGGEGRHDTNVRPIAPIRTTQRRAMRGQTTSATYLLAVVHLSKT